MYRKPTFEEAWNAAFVEPLTRLGFAWLVVLVWLLTRLPWVPKEVYVPTLMESIAEFNDKFFGQLDQVFGPEYLRRDK